MSTTTEPRPRPSTTRYEFSGRPTAAVQTEVCAWLRRHGIDPDHVVIPGWIERDEQSCQVSWLGFDPAPGGKPRLAPRADGRGKEIVITTRSVQLDTPPAPFPTVIRKPA